MHHQFSGPIFEVNNVRNNSENNCLNIKLMVQLLSLTIKSLCSQSAGPVERFQSLQDYARVFEPTGTLH